MATKMQKIRLGAFALVTAALLVTVLAVFAGVRMWKDVESYNVVYEGSVDAINRFFYENGWSDGLPIVPPTAARVDEFLKFTDRAPDEALHLVGPHGDIVDPDAWSGRGPGVTTS